MTNENASLIAELDSLRARIEQLESLDSERIEVEEELRCERDFNATVLHTVGALVLVLDVDGRIVMFNQACERSSGYRFSEVEGQCFWEVLLVPDERDAVRTVFRHVMTVGQPIRFENYWVTKQGESRLVEWTIGVIRNTDGSVQNVITAGLDVTERRRAEDALRKSEENYRLLIENQTDMIVKFDTNGRLLFASPSYCKTFDITLDEVYGTVFSPSVHEDDLAQVKRSFEEVYSPPFSSYVEHRALTKDGCCWQAWVHTAVRNRKGEVTGVVTVGRDITARKQMEHALRASEERFRTLIQHLSDIVWVMGEGGKIFYETPSVTRILGYEPGKLLGANAFQFVHPHDLARVQVDFAEVVRKENKFIPTEFRFRHADGSWIVLEAIGNNLMDNPAVNGIVITARDVSERDKSVKERERLEAQIRHVQKLETLGTLAGGIAHDFNNILTPILGFLQMALRDLEGGHQARPKLERVQIAARRAADLVQQILAFSGKGDQERRPVQLQLIINDVLKLLRATLPSSISVTKRLYAANAAVIANPTQMHQVIMNLCTNAFHAMRERGGTLEVSVEVQQVRAQQTQVDPLEPGDYVVMSVKDSGHGMDKATLDRVFEPFFTTKPVGEGSGMGLSVAHGIVQSHGGRIHVKSTLGEGTTFQVYLPLCREADLEEEEMPTEEELLRGCERILVVDDEESIRHMAEEMLKGLGYEVTSVSSVALALDLLRERSEEFDLVVTDQTMPGSNGIELARELRQIRSDIPVILATGYGSPVSIRDRAECGIAEIVSKPIGFRRLGEAVRRVLDEQR